MMKDISFPMIAICPYRSYCMNDIFSIQVISSCRNRVPRSNITNFLPFSQQLFLTCSLIYVAVCSPANKRPGIRSVYYRIRLYFCYIVSDNLKRHWKLPPILVSNTLLINSRLCIILSAFSHFFF